ncbi:dTDP-4-keto-6-deoxy-D-glucose epimerase [Calidifontibacter sp. DB0510]|uniref:dTDP-4-keto-6-deoxy-D-glucose epimerase n=1 Tax=Metallococcus carri TaxID=1656884 RepID=A0A967EAM4_9MICO|nr:dTDP-4-dehydrorhamnose 3,5-epimerase family protein [Metallococcus carri]NHN56415.1 dTDP-4-keto-6-deoxy-D-glucose epimerase [Metallococcus carri]NOP36039.1 dTDP-4-dehydrorhamnose 3,5-epimerase family protein [Calidifontibacter sp. DB2511S]
MQIEPLRIDGAYVVTPRQFPDDRGVFLESFRADHLAEQLGHRMQVRQTNISVSARGTVRGVHFAEVPPSQAKYVTAASGALLDFVVDLRVGSPTFGKSESVLLDENNRRAVYLAEGLGHAFVALADHTTAVYLCSQVYAPAREHGIHPLDPALGLAIPDDITPTLSPKDATAPTLREAAETGLLPRFEDCQRFAADLRG